jgi:hypothetical protein
MVHTQYESIEGITMLGINCPELVVLQTADMQRVLTDIAAYGFTSVRLEIPALIVNPSAGVWNWNAVTSVRDFAASKGLTLLPVLGVHNPTGYTAASYAEFCARAADLLRAPVYELGNEPNLGQVFSPPNATAVAAQLKAATPRIKAVQPNAIVLFPGLAACEATPWWQFWLQNTTPEKFLTDAVSQGAVFDAVGYHPYALTSGFGLEAPSPTQPMIARVAKLAALVKKPVYATEWGFDTSKVSDATAASWFTIEYPLLTGVASWFFAWRNYAGHGGVYGLVDENNVPRQPLYDTVHAKVKAAA